MALAEKDCTVFNHSSGKTSKALLCVQYCIHACLMHPEKKWLKKVHSPCAHKLDGNKFTCHTTTYLTCFPPHKSIWLLRGLSILFWCFLSPSVPLFPFSLCFSNVCKHKGIFWSFSVYFDIHRQLFGQS